MIIIDWKIQQIDEQLASAADEYESVVYLTFTMINKFIQTLLAISDTKANTTRMHGEYVANHIQSFD